MAYTTTAAKSLASQMDTKFDFDGEVSKNFLSKPRVLGTKFTEQNRIDDEQITIGLVKTLISTEKDMYRLTKTKFGFSLRPETEGKVILGGNVGQLATGCFMTENPGPKIPRIALETVVEWYRRITHKNGQEAQVVFYWNRDKVTTVKDADGVEFTLADIPGVHVWSEELFSYTPKQYNSGSLTEVADSDEWYKRFNDVFNMYVETHSHNSMAAFASGTDTANSENDGFQLVFGHLNTDTIEMYSWMTIGQVLRLGMLEKDLDMLIERHPDSEYLTTERVSYPSNSLVFDESVFDKWDEQVIVRPVATKTYAYGGWGTAGDVWGYGGDYAGDTLYAHNRYTKPVTQKRKTRTDYSAGSRFGYTAREEYMAVAETFNATVEANPIHKLIAQEDETYTYEEVLAYMAIAFLKGYEAKKSGPYTVTDYTVDRLDTVVAQATNDIFDTLFEMVEDESAEGSAEVVEFDDVDLI